jgi:hypothetical protein
MKAHGRADLARVSRAHSQIRPLRLRSLPEAGLTKPAERSDLPTEIGTTHDGFSSVRHPAIRPATSDCQTTVRARRQEFETVLF